MRLPKRVQEKVNRRLVERVNELYHDLEGGLYDDRHKGILHFEEVFWKETAEKYIVAERRVVCLDYGTGTGFVPVTISPLLKQADSLICCDLSSEMLKVAERRLKGAAPKCECIFRKIEGEEIPVETDSVNVITVNAVLHHIHGLAAFAKECERILKPAGNLIIAHEPNKESSLPFPGNAVRSLARFVFKPKTVFVKTAAAVPFAENLMRRILSRTSESYRKRNEMLQQISGRLQEEGLIDFELRGTEIQQIADIHTQYGFALRELLRDKFTGFELVESETFNHLGFYARGKLARRVDEYIKRSWPDAGVGLRLVLKRKP